MAITIESAASHKYLDHLQEIIKRMANNSASSKTACITIVSAILVLAIDKGKPLAIGVAFLPVVCLALLDAYYLSIEHDFIDIYEAFVNNLRINPTEAEKTLFSIELPTGNAHRMSGTRKALQSASVWLFYSVVCVMLMLALLVARVSYRDSLASEASKTQKSVTLKTGVPSSAQKGNEQQ